MGYYSTIEETPKINKPKEFLKALKEKQGMNDDGSEWENFWIDNIKLDDENLSFDEWNFKVYEIEGFVKWLNQFEPEGDLILRGEEGEVYGFRFKKGKIIIIDGEVIYKEGKELE